MFLFTFITNKNEDNWLNFVEIDSEVILTKVFKE